MALDRDAHPLGVVTAEMRVDKRTGGKEDNMDIPRSMSDKRVEDGVIADISVASR
ncbi:hypothetical protein GCM10022198_11030 [Klugiella xanthotipulae]